MRTAAPALLTAVVVVASLAACAPAADTAAGCTPFAESGDASSIVTADGSFGADPGAAFPSPLVTAGVERSVVETGEADEVVPRGGVADVEITVYPGSGEAGAARTPVIATGYSDDELILRTATEDNAIDRAIACTAVGSRVAVTATAADAFQPGALAQAGIADDDTLVLVIDVLERFLGKSDGVNQLPKDGLPTVATAVDGTPGITIPSTDAPETSQTSVIKAGGGVELEEGDEVVVKYTGWLWDDEATVFDSTWERGGATSFELGPDGGLVAGFTDGLVGQQVGSQVLIVVAPEDGYPEGTAPQSIPAGSTMIFVVDILGVRG